MKYTYQYLEDKWTNDYLNFIQNNLDKDVDWEWLSLNKNITWDIIDANPDKNWSWVSLSQHPNTFMLVRDNLGYHSR